MDSRDRGETLDQFLDHAALVSECQTPMTNRPKSRLMTLHAAKGWSFAGVSCRTGRGIVSAFANFFAAG